MATGDVLVRQRGMVRAWYLMEFTWIPGIWKIVTHYRIAGAEAFWWKLHTQAINCATGLV